METAAMLLEALRQKKETLTGAESLTGGAIAAGITAVPGASSVFRGAFVTYCDDVKHSVLGVPEEVLQRDGAISSACAAAMAEGAALKAHADMAYASTGNAGPSAQEGKPVGLVYTGVYYKGKAAAFAHHFTGDRESIRVQTVEAALRECLNAVNGTAPAD